jgi:hypothetical protein
VRRKYCAKAIEDDDDDEKVNGDGKDKGEDMRGECGTLDMGNTAWRPL